MTAFEMKSPGEEIPLCMIVAIEKEFAMTARLVEGTKFYDHVVGYRRLSNDQLARAIKC
jgi:hypothetical protein